MKTHAILLSLALSTGAVTTTHAAEVAEGVLEKGSTYSALLSASPESGDLIGYAFKNDSAAGKAILKSCLPGLFCKISKSTLRAMNSAPPLKTTPEPSGWIEVTAARSAVMETTVFGYDKTAKSRYGVLSVREDDNTLLFKGKPVQPKIEGNNSLSIVASYELGKNDVFLLQNNGGTACPALFTFVTINAAGLKATPEFGTCSDIIYPTMNADTLTVTVAMVGFTGPFESQAKKQKFDTTKTMFRFVNDQLTENGKIVK